MEHTAQWKLGLGSSRNSLVQTPLWSPNDDCCAHWQVFYLYCLGPLPRKLGMEPALCVSFMTRKRNCYCCLIFFSKNQVYHTLWQNSIKQRKVKQDCIFVFAYLFTKAWYASKLILSLFVWSLHFVKWCYMYALPYNVEWNESNVTLLTFQNILCMFHNVRGIRSR